MAVVAWIALEASQAVASQIIHNEGPFLIDPRLSNPLTSTKLHRGLFRRGEVLPVNLCLLIQ